MTYTIWIWDKAYDIDIDNVQIRNQPLSPKPNIKKTFLLD